MKIRRVHHIFIIMQLSCVSKAIVARRTDLSISRFAQRHMSRAHRPIHVLGRRAPLVRAYENEGTPEEFALVRAGG